MSSKLKLKYIQWIGPALLLILVLVCMMFNFSAKSRTNAGKVVNRNLEITAEECVHNFNDIISRMENVGVPTAKILGYSIDNTAFGTDMGYATEVLKIAAADSGSYMACLCDEKGNAISGESEKFSIADMDFFKSVYEKEDVNFLYAINEEDFEDSFIVSIPIPGDRGSIFRLLLFYSLEDLGSVTDSVEFSIWNGEALMDKAGNMAAVYGTNKYLKQGGNIFDIFKNNVELTNKIRTMVNQNIGDIIEVDEANTLVLMPLGSGDWSVVFGVSGGYIDKQIEQQWVNSRNMLLQLIIVICVFVLFIVCISIIATLYRNKKQKQLENKADTDLLTGLNNKLATERKIKEFMEANPDSQSMLFIFDIDNFKKINDTMGHAFGDEVLRSLGQQIRVIFRVSDIIGRAGGDEFIVFLKNISDADVIRREAKKVEDFFKDFKAGEYTKYSATASIGAAIFPQEGADFESLYKAADSALYKAKKRGKNQLAFYNEDWLDPDKK